MRLERMRVRHEAARVIGRKIVDQRIGEHRVDGVEVFAIEHAQREAARFFEQRVVGVRGADEVSEAPAHVDVALAQDRDLALYQRNRLRRSRAAG